MGEVPNPAEVAAAEEFTAKIAGENIVEADRAEAAEKAAASEAAQDFFERGGVAEDEAKDIAA